MFTPPYRKQRSGVPDAMLKYVKRATHYWNTNDTCNVLQRHIEDIAIKINVNPIYVPIGVLAIFLIICGVLDRIITNIVGFLYPAYMSFKALETNTTDDDKQWLTYWVVYAAFSVMETVGDRLLYGLPFYFVFKIVFLLWLFLPQFQGATFMYMNLIRPLLLRHERDVDGALNQLVEKFENVTTIADSQPTVQREFKRTNILPVLD